MAWAHASWAEQPTLSAKVSELSAHVTEVSNAIQNPATASDGVSYNPAHLQSYLNTLLPMWEKLSKSASRSPRITRGRLIGSGAKSPTVWQGFQ